MQIEDYDSEEHNTANNQQTNINFHLDSSMKNFTDEDEEFKAFQQRKETLLINMQLLQQHATEDQRKKMQEIQEAIEEEEAEFEKVNKRIRRRTMRITVK